MKSNSEQSSSVGNFALVLLALLIVLSTSVEGDAARVSLKVDNVEIVELLKSLAAQSDYNVAIGSGVTGKVTVHLDSIEVIEAVAIITELAGAAYIVEDGTIKVLTAAQYVETYGGQPFDKRRLVVFEMSHVPLAQISAELNKLKSPKGLMMSDARTNRLYVLETPEVLSLMRRVVDYADTEQSFRVYEPRHVTCGSLMESMKGVLTGSAQTVIDQGQNRLTVFDREENLDRLDQFVQAYDRPSPLSTRAFNLQYTTAAEVSSHILSLLTPDVGKAISDTKTNQLIVTDLPSRLEAVSAAVANLDRKTQEVYIEAKIVQVSLTDDLKLGVNWQAFTDKIHELGPVDISGDFNVLSSGDQGLRFTSGLLSEKNYEFVLEALSEVGTTDLLSSPHITAVNNRESRILVGSSIPYKTIDTREEDGSIRTFEKVTMVEVGVKLYVTPTINDSDFVSLKIKPEVSSVTGFTEGIPIVEKTEAETEVLIRDGVTLIIGGLIKNENRETVKKIPLLGDIPLLGKLFSSTDRQLVKSELIIFITPHIISGDVTQTRGEG
jgi:type II secretory pathway component GspD/PulD (secretin)